MIIQNKIKTEIKGSSHNKVRTDLGWRGACAALLLPGLLRDRAGDVPFGAFLVDFVEADMVLAVIS
jgi:hypothetical protein